MTREEAIAILQDKYDCCKSFYDLAAHPEEDYPEMAKYLQALQIALTALRPVSREQVEKVWRGGGNQEIQFARFVVKTSLTGWMLTYGQTGCQTFVLTAALP